MKKVYSLIFASLLFAGIAQAQCTIDSTAITVPGVNPGPNQLPCIVRNVAYDQTIQGKIQDTWDTSVTILIATENFHVIVDSARIDSIAGLPTGITWVKNPDILLGGGNGCLRLSGTTTDSAGRYNLAAFGTAWLHVIGSGAYAFDSTRAFNGDMNRWSPFGGYYVDVINQGAQCRPVAGINDFNPGLNSALAVYPNPNSGVFEVRLNAGTRVNGEMNIIDITGRVVFTQKLDVVGLYNTSVDLTSFAKGLYTVQLRTAEGFASKNISIE